MVESYKNKTAIDANIKEMISAGYMLELTSTVLKLTHLCPTLSITWSILVGLDVKVMLETLQQDKRVIYVVSRKKYLIPEKIKKFP